jgi:uncharacterized protein YdeI (YjbR/CyaY-like superfamily)
MANATHNYDLIFAKDRKVWRKWLQKNHAKAPGIWLGYYKKHTEEPTVTYAEAVEEALCFGWIDTTSNPIDDRTYKQLFTPRKAKSTWSQLNKTRIDKMIAESLMTDAGMEKIEAAKADGSWTKLDDVENLVIPPDLQKALNANKDAKKYFEAYGKTNKKYVLHWLNSKKSPELRAKIIAEVVAAAAENTIHPRYIRPSKKK